MNEWVTDDVQHCICFDLLLRVHLPHVLALLCPDETLPLVLFGL